MADSKAYLGVGWGFPPTFDIRTKSVDMVRAEEDIQQSLHILLSTALEERVMQPQYGCNLRELLFEPLTNSLATYISDLVRNAILYHEPRIKADKISLSLDQQLQGVVLISIDYTIISTNSRFNFVYPFYIQEGIGSP